jgi:hypothetical protein
MKKKSSVSLFLFTLLILVIFCGQGCTNKKVVCGLVLIEENDSCTQNLLKANMSYTAAINNCNAANSGTSCEHIVDPAARARCYLKVDSTRNSCTTEALNKLNIAMEETNNCIKVNQSKYSDCLDGN